jgi:DNA-binding response OmpR family regulator
MLEASGHHVLEAVDGRVAWRMLQTDHPDLVIMDVTMPGPSGLEVCRAMRDDERFVAVPVIILTASGYVNAECHAIHSGATAFMQKPFSPAALTHLIDGLLRQ